MYVYMIFFCSIDIMEFVLLIYGLLCILIWVFIVFLEILFCIYIVFNCFFVFCKFFCNDYKLIFEFIKLLVKFLMLIIGIK